ncbi:MAG: abortive infection family protein [Bryobacterales bacterium]|nr:abortive infection family protein [Bryobacterales bacterium]
MSDLTKKEGRKFERLLGMESGYVLDFSNRTFEEFVLDHTDRNIYDFKYDYGSGSKANRLRGFWKAETNYVVGKLMQALADHQQEGEEEKQSTGDPYWKKTPEELQRTAFLREECRRIAKRLLRDQPVPELDALSAISDERDFDVVAQAIREAIEKNEPESALDRLHTFVIKYVRTLCAEHGLTVTRDKPLHSLFGEYVKSIQRSGIIESEMTIRILKSSISTLEAFNDVRNNQSLAHDNPILNYDEALLIFNHVSASIRFLNSLQGSLQSRAQTPESMGLADGDVPL